MPKPRQHELTGRFRQRLMSLKNIRISMRAWRGRQPDELAKQMAKAQRTLSWLVGCVGRELSRTDPQVDRTSAFARRDGYPHAGYPWRGILGIQGVHASARPPRRPGFASHRASSQCGAGNSPTAGAVPPSHGSRRQGGRAPICPRRSVTTGGRSASRSSTDSRRSTRWDRMAATTAVESITPGHPIRATCSSGCRDPEGPHHSLIAFVDRVVKCQGCQVKTRIA